MMLCFTPTLLFISAAFALFLLNKLLLSALVSYICQSEDIIGYDLSMQPKQLLETCYRLATKSRAYLHFFMRELVLGGPNCQQTFSAQPTKVKKCLFLFISSIIILRTVSNSDKHVQKRILWFIKINTTFKGVVIGFTYKTMFFACSSISIKC